MLVADFESGSPNTSFGSNWYKISDKVAGGSSQVQFEVIDGGAAKSKKALRMTGKLTSDFQYGPFAGMGATVDKNGKDLSGYTGLRFYARGDGGTYRVSVPSVAVTDHNEYGKEFVAGKAWRLVMIPFNQLKQGDWGHKTAWSGKDVKGVELTANGAPRDFQLDIDQISFY
jgi:complex I intermediate-associated protein 30 (CIA30)